MSESAEFVPIPEGAPGSTGDSTIVRPGTAPRSQERRHASLVVVQGTEIGREFRVRRIETALGRSEDAAIHIPDDQASRLHARVLVQHRSNGRRDVILRDLGSTNGTWVNGRRITEVILNDGDKVQIGGTILKFVLQDDLDARFHEEVRYRIAYDQLTGLLNKESLYASFDAELKRCVRGNRPLAVLMMDLDRFKSVNDTHGHLMGSLVLSQVGRLLRESLRSTDVVARYGGEEFLAYLVETTAEEASVAAERIRGVIAEHAFLHRGNADPRTAVRVTISIGVSEFPSHGTERDALIAAADRALYRAKTDGRNLIRRA